jgi:CRP/FNR family transcriptional regulator
MIPNAQLSRIRLSFPCFSSVPDDKWQRSELVSITPATPHSVREGRLLEHALFIVSGGVRIYKLCPSTGREVTLYRVFGGECCPLMMASVVGETEYEASASIEVPTEVVVVPAKEFVSWIDEWKPVRQFVYKQLVGRITDVASLLGRIAFHPIPVRLADFLLAQSLVQHADTPLRLTHDRIAAELGTAREVVSRTLKALQSQGAIHLGRGQIVLLDPARLQRIAESRA